MGVGGCRVAVAVGGGCVWVGVGAGLVEVAVGAAAGRVEVGLGAVAGRVAVVVAPNAGTVAELSGVSVLSGVCVPPRMSRLMVTVEPGTAPPSPTVMFTPTGSLATLSLL